MSLRFLPLLHTNYVNCIGITLTNHNGPYSQIVMSPKTVLKLKVKDFLDIFSTEFSHKLHTNFKLQKSDGRLSQKPEAGFIGGNMFTYDNVESAFMLREGGLCSAS